MPENRYTALIGDDFTGSLDTGVQFVSSKGEPRLTVWPDVTLPHGPSQGILVVDTESRFLDPDAARERVAHATKELLQTGYERFFKKIDSTFRGNVGAELDAMLEILDYPAAALVPAVPSNGRTVEAGRVFVHGVPVGESESGRDPFTPNRSSTIQGILAIQSGRRIEGISLETIRQKREGLAERIERAIGEGAEIIVFDGETQEDLLQVATALREFRHRLLLAGASGFAQALVAMNGEELRSRSGASLSAGRALIMAGSLMPTTITQADRLVQSKENVTTLMLDTKAAICYPEAEIERLLRGTGGGLSGGAQGQGHLLLRTVSAEETAFAGSGGKEEAAAVAEFVGRFCRELLRGEEFDTLLLTGGSTALAVVRALEIDSLRIKGEVLPGVPLSEGLSRLSGEPYQIITKAGGFGEPGTLERIVAKVADARVHGSRHNSGDTK